MTTSWTLPTLCARALAPDEEAKEMDAMVLPWRQADPRLDFHGFCRKDGWMTDLARRNLTAEHQTRTSINSSNTIILARLF